MREEPDMRLLAGHTRVQPVVAADVLLRQRLLSVASSSSPVAKG